jgi:hypothetical protein
MREACVFVLCVVAGAMPALADGHRSVLVGDDGSVLFGLPGMEYNSTDLMVTSEAANYPEAIKQLIADDLDFVPVSRMPTEIKITGFLTGRHTREASLVLARSEDLLEIRPPISEAEKDRQGGEAFNPFGLYMTVFFTLLFLGNVLVVRSSGLENNLYPVFATIFPGVFAILSFNSIDFVPRLFAIAATLFLALLLICENPTRRYYHTYTGLAVVLMAVAVMLAVW